MPYAATHPASTAPSNTLPAPAQQQHSPTTRTSLISRPTKGPPTEGTPSHEYHDIIGLESWIAHQHGDSGTGNSYGRVALSTAAYPPGRVELHDAAEALPGVLDAAAAEKLSMTAALERLLAIEVDATEARRLAGRLRFACLPTPASLDDFDYAAAAGIDRHLIEELGTCHYLESATNVLMIGPPGVGKTHLSVGLARAAAHAGCRTDFTTAADLAARCHRAAIDDRWATTMRFYAGPTLLVIDLCRYRDYVEQRVVRLVLAGAASA